jgi:hypothetical protein
MKFTVQVTDAAILDQIEAAERSENKFRMKPRRTLERILAGSKDVRFADLVRMVEAFGFRLSRVRGSHHIFTCAGVPELVNIQEVHGEAKPYQIRQFLSVVEKYNLQFIEIEQP